VSVNDDRITGAGERATPAVATSAAPIADPAPLGLAAFALTTFLLSALNAGWMTKATGAAWVPYALAYGGVVQLLAGMWEFRNKNVFGSTIFGSYGGFWIGLGLWVILVARNTPATPALRALYVAQTDKDLGWILLGFAIFNTYMLLISTQTNVAIFSALLLLEATEIILFIGFFTGNTSTIKAGGYVGVVTAVIAWYASAAGVTNGLGGRLKFPVGRPLIS
jgi:succinate-acetate transporter protein